MEQFCSIRRAAGRASFFGWRRPEVRLFHWNEIHWEDLAFPSVHWALHHFDTVRGQAHFPAFGAPADWSMRPPIRRLPQGL